MEWCCFNGGGGGRGGFQMWGASFLSGACAQWGGISFGGGGISKKL